MPVDIVVGGQAGDEGKGKIAAYLAYKDNYDYCVKVGGPNAGHTVFYKGKIFALKSVPSGFVNKKTKLIIVAGTYIIKEWLLKEMKETGSENRFIIDPNCVIITEEQTKAERNDKRMMNNIGSVGTGLGVAIRDRIDRKKIRFAREEKELKKYLKDVPDFLNRELEKGKKILLEGTQGFKLSLLHGEYPYTTSRDTSASNFLSEAGLGPKYVKDIYIVFKPYVSRVGPGPLENEIKDLDELEKYHTKGREIGSVSKRLRRIGKFEWQTAIKAIKINSANKIAITHIDLFNGNKGKEFSGEAKKFLNKINQLSKIYPYPKLALISNGPKLEDIIDIRKR
jgi:adenylosuccinate synthase